MSTLPTTQFTLKLQQIQLIFRKSSSNQIISHKTTWFNDSFVHEKLLVQNGWDNRKIGDVHPPHYPFYTKSFSCISETLKPVYLCYAISFLSIRAKYYLVLTKICHTWGVGTTILSNPYQERFFANFTKYNSSFWVETHMLFWLCLF